MAASIFFVCVDGDRGINIVVILCRVHFQGMKDHDISQKPAFWKCNFIITMDQKVVFKMQTRDYIS